MKFNKLAKNVLCFGLSAAMVLGNVTPASAAEHDHVHEAEELVASISLEGMDEAVEVLMNQDYTENVKDLTDKTIEAAEKLIDKSEFFESADVTGTSSSLSEADTELADAMTSLESVYTEAQSKVDALEGKVTKDDAAEINAPLTEAYNNAFVAHTNAVAKTAKALTDLTNASKAYEAAKQVSDEAAKLAEAELQAAKDALNVAVKAAKVANEQMLNLKENFAEATVLASKWNATAEEALATATANLAAAEEALNAALEAVAAENGELAQAIEHFKACYDTFVKAAENFYGSIQAAIEAQKQMDELYKAYETAKAEAEAAKAEYDRVCAEYGEDEELLNTYEAYAEKLAELENELKTLGGSLEEDTTESKAYKDWQDFINGDAYTTLEKHINNFKIDDVDVREQAVFEAARIIVNEIADGKTVVAVSKTGVPEGKTEEDNVKYGKADHTYFAALNEKGEAVNRYGYQLETDENGEAVVKIYELTADSVTNYIKYNGEELVVLQGNAETGYYIEVNDTIVKLGVTTDSKYYETIELEDTIGENIFGIPTKVNAVKLIEKEIENLIGADLPLQYNSEKDYYYVWIGHEKFGYEQKIDVAVELLGDKEREPYYIELLSKFRYDVEVEEKENSEGYNVQYVYYKDVIDASICENEKHEKSGHVNVVECDVALHCRYNDHDGTVEEECINHTSDEECASTCTSDIHKSSELHGGANADKLVGTCKVTNHKSHRNNGGTIQYKSGILSSWKNAGTDCGMKINGACSECKAGTKEEKCTGGTFGYCATVPDEIVALKGLEYEKNASYVIYNNEEYIVRGNQEEGFFINVPEADETVKRIDLILEKTQNENESEESNYLYREYQEFVSGGTADTFFEFSKNSLGTDSNVYRNEAATLKASYDKLCAKYEEINEFKATYEALVLAYNNMQDKAAVAAEKDLGTLENLPRNLTDLVELFSVSGEVSFEEILEAITALSGGIKDANDIVKMGKAVKVLSAFLPNLELDFGYTVEELTDLGFLLGDSANSIWNGEKPFAKFFESDMGQALTNKESYKYEYFQAWVKALTTKIDIVVKAIDLAKAAENTLIAGVDAVIAGTELADVVVDAAIATAEKELMKATVDVLAIVTDVLGSSEEIVKMIDASIGEAQAGTQKAYLALVAEQNELNQLVIAKPYAEALNNTNAAISNANVLYNNLNTAVNNANELLAAASELNSELTYLENHEHNYVEIEKVEATCLENGYVVSECSICTAKKTDVLEAAGEHAFGEWEVKAEATDNKCAELTRKCSVCEETEVVEANDHTFEVIDSKDAECEAEGFITYKCTACGYEKTKVLDAIGKHTFGEWQITAEATDNKCAAWVRECSECDAVEVVEAKDHTFAMSGASKEATCVEDGFVTYKCSDCGYEKTDIVKATGKHTFGTWDVAVEATDEKCAGEKRVCSVCFAEEEKVAVDHQYVTTSKEATCAEAGYTKHECSLCGYTLEDIHEATGDHSYGEWFENEVATDELCSGQKRVCATCGKEEVREVKDHTFSIPVASKEATCVEDGFVTYECSDCGYQKTDVVFATGVHQDETVVTPATCHADGLKVTACTVCGRVSLSETIPAGHDFYVVENVEPTCEKAGYTITACKNCDMTHVRKDYAATGHNYAEESAVVTAPTCTTAGYTTYTCTICGGTTIGNEVAALGHDVTNWTVTVEPTETTFGVEEGTCNTCGATLTQEVPMITHNYVEVETVVATCIAEGYTLFKCTDCDSSYKANIVSATGHTYESKVTPATCTEAGYTTYACKNCDDSYVADEVAATGHSFGEWKLTTEPTETVPGEETRTCSSCGKEETREVPVTAPEVPDTEEPDTEEPDTEVPDTEVPDTEEPDTEVPDTEVPDTEVPDTEEPDTEVPGTEEPDTEVPDTETPDTETPVVPEVPTTPDNDEAVTPETPADTNETVEEVVENLVEAEEEEAEVEEVVIIEEEDTPLASGETEAATETVVVIEDEETPLAAGQSETKAPWNPVAMALAGVGALAVGGVVVAGSVSTGNGSMSIAAAIVAFIKKIFKK